MCAAGVAASVTAGCKGAKEVVAPSPYAYPRLTARVSAPTLTAPAGATVPYTSGAQVALLYVPNGYMPSTPVPLVLMLHGAGSEAINALDLFQPYADAAGIALLAVDSHFPTWDIIYGSIGPDLTFMDTALRAVFNEVNVDPARVMVEGFSDGASYALALGRTNGDLFSHAMSFSAGYMPPYSANGRPKFFMSHGVDDTVLSVNSSGRFLSAELKAAGYDVDYVEFEGGHEVPDSIVQQAIAWMAG